MSRSLPGRCAWSSGRRRLYGRRWARRGRRPPGSARRRSGRAAGAVRTRGVRTRRSGRVTGMTSGTRSPTRVGVTVRSVSRAANQLVLAGEKSCNWPVSVRRRYVMPCHGPGPKVAIVRPLLSGLATIRRMRRSRTRRPAAIYAVLQAVTVVLALWLSKHFQVARLGATLVALAPTVPGAYLAWAAYRDDRREAAADTDAKVKKLAAVVAAAETRQRAQLIGPGAHRIDVTFDQRTEPANNATGAAAHGRLTNIVSYYQNLRPARLAITGDPGAGKTLLALDLILGLLTHPGRTDTDPSRSASPWPTGIPTALFRNGSPTRSTSSSGTTALPSPTQPRWWTATTSCRSWTAWTRWTPTPLRRPPPCRARPGETQRLPGPHRQRPGRPHLPHHPVRGPGRPGPTDA